MSRMLVAVSSFRKKFAGILPEKEILGSKRVITDIILFHFSLHGSYSCLKFEFLISFISSHRLKYSAKLIQNGSKVLTEGRTATGVCQIMLAFMGILVAGEE